MFVTFLTNFLQPHVYGLRFLKPHMFFNIYKYYLGVLKTRFNSAFIVCVGGLGKGPVYKFLLVPGIHKRTGFANVD